MVTLGLRYSGCAFHHGHLTDTFGQQNGFSGNGGGIMGLDPHIFVCGEAARPYIAPSRYSEVRKVVFWVAFRHEQTGGVLPSTVRIRIGPSSTSDVNRNAVETIDIAPGSIQPTFGAASVWSALGPTNDATLYPLQGSENRESPLQSATHLGSSKAQLLKVEFERFDASAADFFNDWDGIAALSDDDKYLAYWVGIERVDGNAWTNTGTGNVNNAPVILGVGLSVVQAPGNPNNGCTMFAASAGLYQNGAIASGSFGQHRGFQFPYREVQWDNVDAIHLIIRQAGSAGGINNGQFSVQVRDYENNSFTNAVRATYSFDNLQVGNRIQIARTGDMKIALQDGDNLVTAWQSDNASPQDLPWAWWEVIQKDFTKKVTYHTSSIGVPIVAGTFAPAIPPPVAWAKDESYFDPNWYDNFPDELIISELMHGSLRHNSAGNDTGQRLSIHADLGADVSTSAFTQDSLPDLSSTPNATIGYKFRYDDLTAFNPLRLIGDRKFKTKYEGTVWTASTDDTPGTMGVAYALSVPNSEFPALGPLFDVDAFSAEGCAATSAGLGEPPLLIIANGSGIPKKFNPTAAGTAGEIEDAGIPVPFEGEVPTGTPFAHALSPAGGLGAGYYEYRYTFRNCCTNKESDPNPDPIIVNTTGASPSARVILSFAGVRIPSDPQICEICVYRSVILGGPDETAFPVLAKVGCFDPDTTSLFEDTTGDSELDFTNEGLSILNAPNPCAPIVVDFRNRLFMMGDIPNLSPAGTVSVVNGSDIVEGSLDVAWTRCVEGKFIQIAGDCRSYEILRLLPSEDVSPANLRLRLVDLYEGSTDTDLDYSICGRPNRLWISEPLEPEYWPNANFLDVEPGDGDRLMGGVSNFDRLVICKRRKTYVLTFRENPATEVIVPSRISSDIGCIGPRTFAQVASGSVWLSDRGLALYDGRTVRHLPESDLMNNLFVDPDNPNYVRRDRNGRVIDAVGVFYPAREQYLLLVPTVNTDRGCNLMVVWDTSLQNVTLLKFCQEFQSMVVAKDSDGNDRVYMGDTNGFVWIYDVGDTDGAGFPNATGTVRGTVSDSGLDASFGASFLEDTDASFITGGVPGIAGLSGLPGLSGALDGDDMGLAGSCVYTRPANAGLDDPWIVRTIFAATSTRLYVTPGWGSDAPGAGDDYMIGAINFVCLFKPQNYGTDDHAKRDWRQVIVHEPESFASRLRVELLPDFQLTDPEELTVTNDAGITGGGRIFNMDYTLGRQVQPVGRKVHHFMGVRLSNFAPEEPIRVINHLLMVTPRQSK